MKLNLPFVLVICQFDENCIGVRRAQMYHLKWVEKNHARLSKFLLQVDVRFYDVLIRSCPSDKDILWAQLFQVLPFHKGLFSLAAT